MEKLEQETIDLFMLFDSSVNKTINILLFTDLDKLLGNWTNFVSYSLSVPTHKYGRRQFKLPILFYFSNFAIQHFNLFHSPSMRRNDTNNKFLLSVMKCFSKKQRLTTTRMVSISLDKDYWRKLTILLSKPNKFRSLDQFSWLSWQVWR